MMESDREHNAREDIEAEVRILVLVQLKLGLWCITVTHDALR